MLQRRVRFHAGVAMGAIALQFALLGVALRSDSPAGWILYAVGLVAAVAVVTIHMPRARRLSKRYTELTWGEQK